MKIISNENIAGSVNNMWQVAKIIILDPYANAEEKDDPRKKDL